jgi:hypothetical protein
VGPQQLHEPILPRDLSLAPHLPLFQARLIVF